LTLFTFYIIIYLKIIAIYGNTSNQTTYIDPNTTYIDPNINYFDNSASTTTQVSTRQICPVCYGSGSYTVCNGKGWTVGYSGSDYACTACDDYSGNLDVDAAPTGNGKCSTCHGSGFID